MTNAKDLKELLCDLQVPNTIRFSPDARQILYSTNLEWEHKKGRHPVSTLWLAETGEANSSRQITAGPFKDHFPRWDPRGQSIAFISDRSGAGEKWAIYVQNVRNGVVEGEPYPVTDVENERPIPKFEFSPDGNAIAFICADPKTDEEKARDEKGWDMSVWGEDWVFNRIRVVDLGTKQVRRVTGSSHPRIVPERHVLGFAWSHDSKHLAVVSVKSSHVEEPFLTGSDIAVLHLPSQTIYDLCHLPRFPKDIIWAHDGYLYFISGKPADKVLAGQALVSGQVLARVQCGVIDQLYLHPDRVIFDKLGEIRAYDAAYTTDGDEIVLAFSASDTNHPLEVYTTAASGGASVQLSNHGAALKNRAFGSCTFLTCPSTDKQVQLDGIFLTPSSSDPKPKKPLPTVVLIHDGPSDRDTNRFNTNYYYWTPYLLSLGYGILLINYRGSTGKGRSFAEYSIGGAGKHDWKDIIAMTTHAITEKHADKDRLLVGGWGHGGFLSYLCCVRNGPHSFGWKFRAAIAGSGMVDMDAMALTSDLGGTLGAELNDGASPWNRKRDFVGNRDAAALWLFRGAVQVSRQTGQMVVPPMLILHGERDERCPITQAWGMRRALESAGLPYEFVTYPRQPHIFTERNFWVDMLDRVGKFCEKHIGPGEKVR
ncbi:acylamino-acid-releasing enzyme [Lecanosticta acicola]|uniref:Dipeptidyl-peptidase V n=1 Tax=Lecanosticta acicola TaxID=111012 RepID=A0AAI8YST8_9PEZI|nr:acylamino-acid-releasing enzyme [Lecanosticta acicola]